MTVRQFVCGAGRPLVWVTVATLLAGCAAASHDAGRADAEELARAEEAFATAAQVDGMRAAFLNAMADDATLFRPGPVNGKAYLTPRPDPPLRLEWRPQRVTVAASGELGWSTGPFRATPDAASDRSTYGQFFTVWRKSPSGRWQVLIDLGVGHPDAVGWQAPLDLVPRDTDGSARSSISVAESDFARACAAASPVEAYRSFGAAQVRLLRDDRSPIDGLERVPELPDAGGRWNWTPGDSAASASGDLGWAMGRYRVVGVDGTSASGTYVRVWHAERGRWKILGDVLAETERSTSAQH